MRTEPRYVVRHIPVIRDSKKMLWRIYDTRRASYPVALPNGRRIEDHYPTQAMAQAVADDLNKEEK